MDYKVLPAPNVIKYLKKLKEKPLKKRFTNMIYDEIAIDPYRGEAKTGDLAGIRTMAFRYAKIEYRIAYEIEDDMIIPILLCGTHENFYKEVKRIRGGL